MPVSSEGISSVKGKQLWGLSPMQPQSLGLDLPLWKLEPPLHPTLCRTRLLWLPPALELKPLWQSCWVRILHRYNCC